MQFMLCAHVHWQQIRLLQTTLPANCLRSTCSYSSYQALSRACLNHTATLATAGVEACHLGLAGQVTVTRTCSQVSVYSEGYSNLHLRPEATVTASCRVALTQ
jgi:hypothetical protein